MIEHELVSIIYLSQVVFVTIHFDAIDGMVFGKG